MVTVFMGGASVALVEDGTGVINSGGAHIIHAGGRTAVRPYDTRCPTVEPVASNHTRIVLVC